MRAGRAIAWRLSGRRCRSPRRTTHTPGDELVASISGPAPPTASTLPRGSVGSLGPELSDPIGPSDMARADKAKSLIPGADDSMKAIASTSPRNAQRTTEAASSMVPEVHIPCWFSPPATIPHLDLPQSTLAALPAPTCRCHDRDLLQVRHHLDAADRLPPRVTGTRAAADHGNLSMDRSSFPEPIDALMARLENQEHRRLSARGGSSAADVRPPRVFLSRPQEQESG